MSSAKITLIGFYKLFDSLGDDLFKNLIVPDGIDKDTLIDNILLRGGEFEVLFSNPEFTQIAIGSWSKKWERTFQKWFDALSIEYSPLENYDRREDFTDTSHAASTDSTTITGSSITGSKVSAFNSDTLREDTQDSTSLSNSNTSTSSIDNTNSRVGRIHGNIGVTTSQQMLMSELDIATWNIYEHITDVFLSEFVIPIY